MMHVTLSASSGDAKEEGTANQQAKCEPIPLNIIITNHHESSVDYQVMGIT